MTVSSGGPAVASAESVDRIVSELRVLATRALARMYRPEERLFAFRLRREGDAHVLEGVSRRYTAIALIGLARQSEEIARGVLARHSAQEVCDRLVRGVDLYEDLGEVALTLWAARALRHSGTARVLGRLRAMDPANGRYPTVKLAWSLMSLVADGSDAEDETLAASLAERLLRSFHPASGLFPHWPADVRGSFLRSHVTCFADFVYPIQALSHYHMATGSPEALGAAQECARRMCELQGPAGQWWWHFDVRTGDVLERYPVYSVHQDSMAPMALFALEEADGQDRLAPIRRGWQWLLEPPENPGGLIDRAAGVIWRKVARHEPPRLVRGLQAAASRLHASLRAPGVDTVFRPGWIDHESRPYHMGWILYAWPASRIVDSPEAQGTLPDDAPESARLTAM